MTEKLDKTLISVMALCAVFVLGIGLCVADTVLMQTYTFEDGTDGWQFSGQIGDFTPPLSSAENGTLGLTAQSSEGLVLGLWYRLVDEIALQPSGEYIVEFDIATDETDQTKVPDMRLLAVSQDSQRIAVIVINSNLHASDAPTTASKTYTVNFTSPSQIDPTYDSLYLYFEMLNIDAENNLSATLYLHEARIYGVDIGPEVEWEKVITGDQWESGTSIQQTPDGGYIICGHTSPAEVQEYDVLLLKTDISGVPEWEKTFGGSSTDAAFCIDQTVDGGYVMAGECTEGTGRGVYLIKTDSEGELEWEERWGFGTRAHSIEQTTDGGYIVAAVKRYAKYDSTGDQEWYKKIDYDPMYQSYESGAAQTLDGGYIIVMEFVLPPDRPPGFEGRWWSYLRKVDSSGETEWERDLDYFGGHSVRQTTDGGYVFLWTDGLVKTDNEGTLEWAREYDADYYYEVRQTSDGGYVIAGRKEIDDDIQVYVLKLNSSGAKEWTKLVGGFTDDYAHSVWQTFDGGYIIGGTTIDDREDKEIDVYLVKLAPESQD